MDYPVPTPSVIFTQAFTDLQLEFASVSVEFEGA